KSAADKQELRNWEVDVGLVEEQTQVQITGDDSFEATRVLLRFHRGKQLFVLRSIALAALFAASEDAQTFFDFGLAITAHDERNRADRGGDAEENRCVNDDWGHGIEGVRR